MNAVAGMESLRSLADLLTSLRPVLSTALGPGSGATALESFYVETIAPVPLMCAQIYRGIARSLLALEPVVTVLRNRSWTPKETSSQHNGYVDQLLQLIQRLHGSLTELKLPTHVHTAILEEAVAHIAEQLVEAFSQIKRVNDEGRNLMQRDVKVLQAALDNLLRRNLLPPSTLSLAHAEAYVAALSLPPDQLLVWAQEHRGYSIKHLSAVVMHAGVAASSLKKKEQQEIISGLQELCAQPAREC